MSLKEYLINCMINEKSIIEELIYIDNRVQHTSLTYDKLIEMLYSINECEILNDGESVAITDGEVENVFKVLISISGIRIIFVDRAFLGINKYLVSRVNLFYGEDVIELDIGYDYMKYINSKYFIVVSGIKDFVDEVCNFCDECVVI